MHPRKGLTLAKTEATETEEPFSLPAEREAAAYQWEAVSEDEGEEIDLPKETPFVGVYRGVKVVPIPNADTGVIEDTNLYLFTDSKGARRSMWGNFRIDQAFSDGAKAPKPGEMVKIEWHGKTDLKGGRTFNRISVFKAAAR